MNPSKIISSLFISTLILLSFLSVFVVPVQGVTTQTVDISSTVAAENFTISYDASTNLGWISGKSANALYKVNMATVLAQGAAAVTAYPSIFPFSSGGGGVGNYVSGPLGNVVQGGLVWTTAGYNSGDALASLNPSTSAVGVYYYPSGTTNFADISTDGLKLYMGEFQKIVAFDPIGSSFSSINTAPCTPNFVFPDGTLLRFTCDLGFGYVNKDGTNLYIFPTGSQSRYMAKDGSGNIWFTSNFAHTLSKCPAPCNSSSSITTYATGIGGDGPFGLVTTPTGNWLSGYADKKVRFFSFGTNAIDPTKDITTTKRPYNGFTDSLGNVWQLALGSAELIMLSAIPTTTTTTVVTTTSGTETITTTSTITVELTSTTPTLDASGCPIGANCKPHPIVIPFIHISSISRSGGTATVTAFEAFLSGPSSGDFMQWVSLVGCCAMQLGSLNPSNGTFATLSIHAVSPTPYYSEAPPATNISLVNIPTSETKFGWFCNNQNIVQYVFQCDGAAVPVSYRTFSFDAPTKTIVSIQATGTESQGQVSIANLFL